MKKSELKIALLISGGGTTASAVIEAYQKGELTGITPVGVISSRPDALGIAKAKALGIETFVVERRLYNSPELFGEEILRILRLLHVDLVSQNGWLPLTPDNVIEAYNGMIVNQHPGPLDPGRLIDFGGKGMYGARVVCACVAYAWLTGNDFTTEATTHFVAPKLGFDKGDLIRVTKMQIPRRITPVTIADLQLDASIQQDLCKETKDTQKILLPLEHENVIETLRLFAQRKVKGFRRPEPLIPSEYEMHAINAKKIAIQLFPDG